MAANIFLHTDTALAQGLQALFKRLEARLGLSVPVKVFLAGGMAVHLYTAGRVTTDVDAEFGARLPPFAVAGEASGYAARTRPRCVC